MKNNLLNILLTNKEYLLLYNLIGYLFALLFPYRSLPFTPYFQILRRYLSSILFFYPTPPTFIACVRSSVGCVCTPSACSIHALHDWEGEGNTRLGIKRKTFLQVYTKLFWTTIYYANTRPRTNIQSIYLPYKGLGIWVPHIIQEYDLATAVAVRPLTHPRLWKMGSSILAATSLLKLASTTRVSFPSMP